MARFSQGMIQSLMNPSYARGMNQVGLMAGSLPGARRDARREQDRIGAQASINNMLSTANPNDPNVINAVNQVTAAYGIDPTQTQQAVQGARTNAREEERLAMAREQAVYRRAAALTQVQEAADAQTKQRVSAAIEGALAQNPGQVDKVIQSVPEEYRGYAREYVQEIQKFKDEAAKRQEAMANKEALSASQLKEYEEVVGETAVRMYKDAPAEAKGSARGRLERLVTDTLKSKLTQRVSQKDRAMKPPTGNEVVLAKGIVDEAFGGGTWPEFLGGKKETMSEVDRNNFAYAVASKRRTDPEWIPNKDNLIAFWNETNQESESEESTETETIPGGFTEAEWAAMTPEERALFK